MLQKRTNLVNTWKILDEEAKNNPCNQPTGHLQYTSQQVVPGGAYRDQQRKCMINRGQLTELITLKT